MNLNIRNISVLGYRHYDYLKKNRPSTVNVICINGTLGEYLKQVNEYAEETLDVVIRKYTKSEGVTEALKASDQLEWVRRMNYIRSRAEEVVLHEIICQ